METKYKSIASTSKEKNIDNIKRDLVHFFKCMQDIEKSHINDSSRKERHEVLFLLLQLKKQISQSISNLNVLPTIMRQEFLCEICSSKITLEPLQDIWECLEKHSHSKSFVDVDTKKEILKTENHSDGISKLESCSHSESSINGTDVQEETITKELIKTSDSEIYSECSVNGLAFEDNIICLEDGIAEVPENSSVIPSSNASSTSLHKSRSWYPRNPLNGVDDKPDILDINGKTSDFEILDNLEGGRNILMGNIPSIMEIHRQVLKSEGFRFKFQSRYSKTEESRLYPKFYRKFDLEGDPIFQKTGPDRTVCLTCCCELLGPTSPPSLMSHTSGGRHLQKIAGCSKIRSIIKNYHDTFLRLDRELQSHQIYFATDDELYLLKCVVCLKYVRSGDVQAHILSELHKKKLIQLSKEGKMQSLFCFLSQHVESYGVKCETPKVTDETAEVEKPKSNVNIRPHNIVKSTDDFDPALMNKLPGRFSKHLKYLKTMPFSVSCHACDKGNNLFNWKTIRLHLVQPSHLVMTNTSTLNYIYHCDVCDKRWHDEIAWILHFNDEYLRHREAAESLKNDRLVEYECSTCKLVLYGDSQSFQKHKKSNPIKRRERARAVTLSKEIKEFFCSRPAIIENAEKLLDDAKTTVSSTDLVAKCLEDLEDALKSKYNVCKAYPFGSRVSGLGCSQSDLDIFIDTGYMYNGFHNQDEQNQTMIISNVLSLIRKRKGFTQIKSIPTARTPIIKLKHKSTNLDCDVSFVHGLSVENTKFLRYCFDLQPISQMLILVVKKWSHLCGLNENITTYALAMLGIFYLQKIKLLPSVQDLKELNRKNVTIVGWETIDYVTPKEEIRKHVEVYNGDFIDLLSGFFKFYSEFNYKLNVVCPLLGTEISKTLFSVDPKGHALPKEMSCYVSKINTEISPEYFRCLSHFCIQDPFDLSHNLTKACSGLVLTKFVKLCGLTHVMLSQLDDFHMNTYSSDIV